MRKIIVAALLIYVGILFAPWIWLVNTYGIHNIPHYDLTIWIFMMLYGLIGLFGFGLFLILNATRDEEPEPKRKKRRKPAPKKPRKPIEETEEEAPAELQVEAPEINETVSGETVGHPTEWDEEEFE